MIHFSCDCCGKELHPGEDDRFVLKLNAYLAPKNAQAKYSDLPVGQIDEYSDDVIELPEPDDDGMDELETLLMEPVGPAPIFTELRYDLCGTCHLKFLADPLNRDSRKLSFSKN
jgi:hypothetical protein